MDDLLCDETWLSRSTVNTHDYDDYYHHDDPNINIPPMRCSAFEFEFENVEAFTVCLEKEISLLPEPNYVNYLHSNHLISSRFRVIQWFLKCRSRFNLSFGTVFYAVNYLDRFVSICQHCNDWKYWMIELLSITCLSIATKFNEIYAISMHEIQFSGFYVKIMKMEGLDYSYQSNTILRMELILLKALGWRLNTVTAYSIVEMVACNIQSLRPHLYEKLISRVTELLLQAILDEKMLEFRQSIIGISALWCSLGQLHAPISDTFIAYIMGLFNQSQKDDLIECHKIMEITTILAGYRRYYYYPSSPTTVLLKE